ncbi:MAG: hypothetical protein ABIQ06_13430 [Caldimonas sp.]
MTSEVIDAVTLPGDDAGHVFVDRRPSGSRAVGIWRPRMRHAIVPVTFLRRVWWADAAVSAVVGAAMAAAAAPLGELIGLPARLLAVAGLSLLPYAAFLVWLATRAAVPQAAAWAPVLLNVVWAIDCIALAVMQPDAGPLLIGFVAVQAVTVLTFAELEFGGLRRSPASAG